MHGRWPPPAPKQLFENVLTSYVPDDIGTCSILSAARARTPPQSNRYFDFLYFGQSFHWSTEYTCRWFKPSMIGFRPKQILIVFWQYFSYLTCGKVHSCCVEIRITRPVTSRHVASCHVISRHVVSIKIHNFIPKQATLTTYGSKFAEKGAENWHAIITNHFDVQIQDGRLQIR